MRSSISWLERQMVCCLVMLLGLPNVMAATLPVSSVTPPVVPTEAQSRRDIPSSNDVLVGVSRSGPYPDSPGAMWAQAADQSQQAPTSQAAPVNRQNAAPPPVGTAVAPSVKAEGSAVSRPAGAAIAPAKQRRIHSFSIRVGLLVGAAIAIGTVTAASLGSSSQPH